MAAKNTLRARITKYNGKDTFKYAILARDCNNVLCVREWVDTKTFALANSCPCSPTELSIIKLPNVLCDNVAGISYAIVK